MFPAMAGLDVHLYKIIIVKILYSDPGFFLGLIPAEPNVSDLAQRTRFLVME
jgi:hypothetical protein